MATNDSHYLCEDDSHAQDVMVCIQTGKSIDDPNRMKFQSNQFFVKSAEEMGKVFQGYEHVLARTMEIAERCNVQLEKVDNPFPQFEVPAGETIDSYFEQIAREGLAAAEPAARAAGAGPAEALACRVRRAAEARDRASSSR